MVLTDGDSRNSVMMQLLRLDYIVDSNFRRLERIDPIYLNETSIYYCLRGGHIARQRALIEKGVSAGQHNDVEIKPGHHFRGQLPLIHPHANGADGSLVTEFNERFKST